MKNPKEEHKSLMEKMKPLQEKWQKERMYSEEEVKEIINLSCEEGMFIQRTINDKVRIPYLRIKDFTAKMFEQYKKKQLCRHTNL